MEVVGAGCRELASVAAGMQVCLPPQPEDCQEPGQAGSSLGPGQFTSFSFSQKQPIMGGVAVNIFRYLQGEFDS